jgi:hypothetical protein
MTAYLAHLVYIQTVFLVALCVMMMMMMMVAVVSLRESILSLSVTPALDSPVPPPCVMSMSCNEEQYTPQP